MGDHTKVFRVRRRIPGTDKVLDARDYGYKAWPMRIKKSTKQTKR